MGLYPTDLLGAARVINRIALRQYPRRAQISHLPGKRSRVAGCYTACFLDDPSRAATSALGSGRQAIERLLRRPGGVRFDFQARLAAPSPHTWRTVSVPRTGEEGPKKRKGRGRLPGSLFASAGGCLEPRPIKGPGGPLVV